jgi:hypothetical protein
VLQVKERAPTFYPSIVFTFGFAVEFVQEFGVASFNAKSAPFKTTKSIKFKPQIKSSTKNGLAKWSSTSTREMQLLKILNQQSVNQMFTMAWPKVIQPQFIR